MGENTRWVTVPLIFLIVLTFINSLSREDVRFWDESSYLARGQELGLGSQPGWTWSPLYSDMYWLVDQLSADPINTYLAVRALSAALVVIATWISLRLFVPPGLALAGGVVVALLPITYSWPGVSNPAAACLLCAVAVIWRWPRLRGWIAASSLTWIAAATRPEFVWIALAVTSLLLVVLIVRTLHKAVAPLRSLASTVLLLLAPVLLIWAYGNPLQAQDRSWFAFNQHYELRFASVSDDPWAISSPRIETDFPGATSILEALAINPEAFILHMGKNLVLLPATTAGHLVGLGGIRLSETLVGALAGSVWIIAFIVTMVLARHRLVHSLRTWIRRVAGRQYRVSAMATGIVTAGVTAALLIIYPRPHYLVVVIALSIWLMGLSMAALARSDNLRWLPNRLLVLLGTGALVLNVFVLFTLQPQDRPNINSIDELNSASKEWRLLTLEEYVDPYLVNEIAVSHATDGYTSFASYLEANHVNLIVDGLQFRNGPWQGFPDFNEFISNPAAFDFEPVIPNSVFWVRRVE